MGTFLFISGVTVVVALVLMALTLRIATQYQRAVIFRLGKYSRTAGPGLYFLWPFIEWQTTLDLRTKTTIVEQQETITRDNVPIKINAVIWQRVVDPMRAVLEVDGDRLTDLHLWRLGPGHLGAIVGVATTTLRGSDYYHRLLGRFSALSHVTVEVQRG